MLRTVERYVLGKLLRTFIPTCLGLCFLFFVGASFRLLREDHLSLQQVLLALPWVVPYLLPYLVPLAYTSTLAFVYGRMVADNEVLAFGALGVPARTLAWPALYLALVLGAFSTWLTSEVVPYCHQMREEALRAVFQQLLQLDRGEGEHFGRTFSKQGFDLYVRRYGPDGLRGLVFHYDVRRGQELLPVQIVAERGRVATDSSGQDRLVLVLEDVDATLPEPAGPGRTAPLRLHFERYVQAISLGGRRRVKAQDLSSATLRREVGDARRRTALAAASGGLVASLQCWDGRELGYQLELGGRFVLSAAAPLMTIIVVPVVLLLRARSPLVPFAVGLLAVAFGYFAPFLLANSVAELLGRADVLYAAVLVPLVVGLALARLAARR